MSNSTREMTYTMGRSKEETERLIQRSGLYEDITRRLLRDAGLFNGMKVLDIGSGAGDVAFAAAELVGSGGAGRRRGYERRNSRNGSNTGTGNGLRHHQLRGGRRPNSGLAE